jgi:hypothetical protein
LPDNVELIQLRQLDIQLRSAGNYYIDDDKEHFKIIVACVGSLNQVMHTSCKDVLRKLCDAVADVDTLTTAIEILKGDFLLYRMKGAAVA